MQKKYRILIVDDERSNRKVLSELLADEFDIVLAKNATQAFQRLNGEQIIDLVLLDIMLPDMDGYEILKRMKNKDDQKDIPVIFITVLDSIEDEEKAFHLGAVDFITKPFHPSIVKLRVKNQIKLIEQKQMLEEMAGIDGLSGINNRRSFDTIYHKEWKKTLRYHEPLSLIMIDVDFFKNYNDFYGHGAGDAVLKEIAKVINNQLNRPEDAVSRYGGEEFVVILPRTEKSAATKKTEEIRKAVESLAITHEKSDCADVVTISLGGVTHEKDDDNPEAFLKQSDEMLYKAKSQGRNRVIWR
ncbi:MAG: diguanylate cyclase [Thermotogota bacterium]|nr:diguanylate cyclase [Thermotogota bacterium]